LDIRVIHSSTKFVDYFNCNKASIVCLPGDEIEKLSQSDLMSSDRIHVISERKNNDSIQTPENLALVKEVMARFDDNRMMYDSPLWLSINVAASIGNGNIYFVGFDGYPNLSESKYKALQHENQKILNYVVSKTDLNLVSLLPTNYDLKVESLYSKL